MNTNVLRQDVLLGNLPNGGWLAVSLALVVTTALWLATEGLPAWVRMWLLVGAEVFAVKWLMLRHAAARGCIAPLRRRLAFFLLWAGTDAKRFLSRPAHPSTLAGAASEWRWAVVKLLAGVGLLAAGVKLARTHDLAGAWLGMMGLVLIGHFGCVHLLSLAWRARGVDAPPLMRTPTAATSLADFWGARWNLAFAVPARELILKPLARRAGTGVATMTVFAASGLLHESVISLPADAGWGLPTAYFLFQGFAVLMEKSALGRALGLGHGLRGWCYVFACTAGPAWWLFHAGFAHNVILPMLFTLNPIIP
jgi:hypothetical protein